MLADWGVSIRQACRGLCFYTSTYHYKSRRPEQAGLEMRIKEIAERRVHVLLRREGWVPLENFTLWETRGSSF